MTITISQLTPENKDIKFCKGRLVALTLEVKDNKDPLPEVIWATLSNTPPSNVGISEQMLLLNIDQTDNKKATAVFYVVPQKYNSSGTNDIDFYITLQDKDMKPLVNREKLNTYTIMDSAKITYGYMDKQYLPCALTNDLLPTDVEHTSTYNLLVTAPDDGKPISGYLVDLRQKNPSGTFFNKLRVFLSNTDTKPVDPIYSKDQSILSFIRAETGADGKINYFFVSTTTPVYCQFNLLADYLNIEPINSIIIADLDSPTVAFPPPSVSAQTDLSGVYLLDSVSGPRVRVDIPVSHSLNGGDIVFGFNNGNFLFYFLYDDSPQGKNTAYFAKADVYSDFGEHKNEFNELCYVVSSSAGSTVTTSSFLKFKAKGGENGNQPDPSLNRDVSAPVIPGAEKNINASILDNPTVNLRIALKSVPGWIPVAGEALIAKIYLNGYVPGTSTLKQGFCQSDAVVITSKMLSDGYADIPYDSSLFIGYDAKYSSPSTLGTFYGEYSVMESLTDIDPVHISEIYSATLDTVPPGSNLKVKVLSH